MFKKYGSFVLTLIFLFFLSSISVNFLFLSAKTPLNSAAYAQKAPPVMTTPMTMNLMIWMLGQKDLWYGRQNREEVMGSSNERSCPGKPTDGERRNRLYRRR